MTAAGAIDARRAAPLRIGINALYLLPGQVGGTEIYVRELLAALANTDGGNEYYVYRNRETGPDLVPPARNFLDRPQPIAAVSRPARIVYEQTRLLWAMRRDRIDVVLNTGYTAPLFATVPMVTIFYDLQYKHHPEFFTLTDRVAWGVLLPLSARRSKRLVVMSEDTKADLFVSYPWSRDRVVVVPHGVDAALSAIADERQSVPPAEKLLLCVSAIRANKNLENLLRAFARFHATHGEYRLVVVGPRSDLALKLEALRDELGLHESVTFTGWIARSDLLAVFARARALVFPSYFEGFGIPILESLTARVPLACSDIPTSREIAGECAAYFDPHDSLEMADAIERVTCDEVYRARIIAEGETRSRAYSWNASAHRLIDELENVVSKTGRSVHR